MKLTVLLGYYNTPPHALAEAVKCIVDQVGVETDLILLDDGSTSHATRKASELLTEMYGLKYDRSEVNQGLAANLNRGLHLAETEYVALMGDDVCAPDRLLKQVTYLKEHPDVDVLGTQLFSFLDADITRKPLFVSEHPEQPEPKPDTLNPYWLVNHATVVYRKSAVGGCVGGYNEGLRRMQDVDLWERMWKNGAVFRNLPDVLYGWRHYKMP